MSSDWAITLVEHRNTGAVLGWNLESPLAGPETGQGPAEGLRFRGWFLVRGGPGRIVLTQGGVVLADVMADLPRPDVARARIPDPAERPALERCGFDITLPRRLGPYRLEAGGMNMPEAESPLMAFDILDRAGGPYAVIGRDRQLFLGGDSNDSIGQFTENRSLPDSSVKSWEANFSAMNGWETDLGLRMALLVAPAKEEIFPDHFPLPRARRTVMDDFRIRFADKGAVIPIHDLRAQRQFAYCETDTHWTDQGASIAARAVLKSWDMDQSVLEALPQAFRIRQRQGDLGIKLEPRRASYELAFAENPDRFLRFDNGVRNQGCLRIWQNPEAPVAGNCLIFGDSFGTNFAQSLTGVFTQVAYAYRPAGFDPLLVGLVKPSHVILQITQRFLHGSPERRGSLFETAATKIRALPEAEAQAVTDRLHAAADGPFEALVAAHLDRL